MKIERTPSYFRVFLFGGHYFTWIRSNTEWRRVFHGIAVVTTASIGATLIAGIRIESDGPFWLYLVAVSLLTWICLLVFSHHARKPK